MLAEISDTARGRGCPSAVEHCAPYLKQKMRAFGGPAHRLAFIHGLVDNMTRAGLGRHTGDSQTIAVCVCIAVKLVWLLTR
jgi:hypothetical protein